MQCSHCTSDPIHYSDSTCNTCIYVDPRVLHFIALDYLQCGKQSKAVSGNHCLITSWAVAYVCISCQERMMMSFSLQREEQ